MNFYRLRVINTILLFIVGILFGIYFESQKGYFKKIFSNSNDYKPIYYGKNNLISSNKENLDYKPVYYNYSNIKNSQNLLEDSTTNVEKNLILDKLKSVSNPMEDNIEITEDDFENKEETSFDISEFLIDPYKFQGKKIIAKKLILLKGEKKENFLFLYFFIRFEKKDFYLIIQSDNKILNDIEDFKIGYYYDVEFRSTKGKFNEGNIAISIKPTGDKTDWASGVNAF